MVFNSATLIGNLGSDLELRTSAAGSQYAKVSLAQNRSYVTRGGDEVKETSWFRLAAYGKVAERMAERVGKGSKVLVEGKLRSYNYERDGKNVQGTELVVLSFEELPRRGGQLADLGIDSASELGVEHAEAGLVEATVPF